MLEALKNKRLLMMAGAGLLLLILLVVGAKMLFMRPSDAELARADGNLKGKWLPHIIPELPPVAFDPQKDWGSEQEKLSLIAAAVNARISGGTRIESGKSPTFDRGLMTVDEVQIDKSLPDQPRIQVRISHHGNRVVDHARMDILFLDNKATLLARRAVNPLVVSGGLYGDKIKPLRPDEVREFYVDATQAPLGWLDQVAVELIYYQFAP
ncbi:hypothetical protein [Candidatus Magnetaquicoccus inordinatus]|uniref:hypothetical protein n=1 Tax=Candidatus Magnetaquicoccus inordinatus TaxID=2496818 RepID=UPI00102B5A1E|nr:hypothetical protein [Candidatus Magnetaquicoccus inordinatus]